MINILIKMAEPDDGLLAKFKAFNERTDQFFKVENHNFIIGLNSAIVSAIITTFYPTRTVSTLSRIIIPPVCGGIGAFSWRRLVTDSLERGKLDCPVCASSRGMLLALTSAAVIPGAVGAALLTRKANGGVRKVEHFVTNFMGPPNLVQRPLLVAAIFAQGALGYIMGSREFEFHLRKILAEDDLEKARHIDT